MTIRGSCVCGAIRFEIDKVLALTHCHCSTCRKLSGAAFATYAHVKQKYFRFVAGEEAMADFESSPGSVRKRCRICGCPAPGRAPYLATVSVPAGMLDDDPGVRPSLHVFVSSCVPWWTIDDDLPKYETWMPGYAPNDSQNAPAPSLDTP